MPCSIPTRSGDIVKQPLRIDQRSDSDQPGDEDAAGDGKGTDDA